MRIKCPECAKSLSLGQPKPGRYRPKCKYCEQPFDLKIDQNGRPEVGVFEPADGLVAKTAKSQAATYAKSEDKSKAVQKKGQQPISGSVQETAETEETAGTGLSAPFEESEQQFPSGLRADQRVRREDGGADGGADGGDVSSRVASAVVNDGNPTDGASLEVADERLVLQDSGVTHHLAEQVSPTQSELTSSSLASHGSNEDSGSIPDRLGGYRILRLLGRGAMGAVYEAKQVSLDRLVALKTIRGRLAENPASLARFTREAYAAAQLTHHNVVQIYDFGEDAGRHFFSMEWVRGGPLDRLIREKGTLEPRMAVAYTVQAARGLQFAHRHGMVHRDIKPANLLLTDDGVIKVADLGLVKIPDHGEIDPEHDPNLVVDLASGTEVTVQGTAVGTPAYMAPEQSIDAAAVDHRADIYSLGCTLFFMLAGRPPFEGTIVSEVTKQHAKTQPPNLIDVNRRVPDELQQIVSKAMAKHPDQRYESLVGMIGDLESYLGITAEGKFSPSSPQADAWEAITIRYRAAAPLMNLSTAYLFSLVAVAGGLTVLLLLAGTGLAWILIGPSVLVITLLTTMFLGSRLATSVVIDHLRLWLGSWVGWDWLLAGMGATAFCLIVLLAGLWPGLVVGTLLGVVAGGVFHRCVVLPGSNAQRDALRDAEHFIRDLRIDGTDEDGLRLFAARYGGKGWQRLYESLFGYESLCKTREILHGDPSYTRSVGSISLRDQTCRMLKRKALANRKTRDHQRLAKIEERGLEKEGLSADEARDRAWQIAAAVMENAKSSTDQAKSSDEASIKKRERIKQMIADARSGKYRRQRDRFAAIRFALSGQTRLLVGCLLLSIFALWGYGQGVFDHFKQFDALETVRSGQLDLNEVATAVTGTAASAKEPELKTGFLGGQVHGWSIGVAGLLLALSSFVSGWRMTPFAVVATVVILFGPTLGVPGLGAQLQPWMIAAVSGLVIYLPGIIVGESSPK
ncbi:MAG: serine/threonine-protein kinase [Rubripirellula sp.]|nr:serine/threonine-protein kinase [Rubripirellula sp.]